MDQVLLLCYQYDPKTGKYSAAVMKSLRLGGVATVIGLAALLLALNRKAKNGRRSVQPASYCFLPFGALLIPCLPERASSFAGDVDAIYLTLVGISVFFIALIAGLEIYFAIKYRRRSPGEIPPKTVPSIPLEVAWIAIPFLICMVMSGQKLFRQLHCATCHKTDGTGRCPVLEGIFGKQVQLQDGRIVTVDESYIRESILDPKAKIAAGYDPIMPNFTGLLSEEQVAQLIAYIK